jgi:hypothetical protein
LKHDFELRRVIFGLSAIISTPAQALPAIVSARLPDIAKQLGILCWKMREERVKILKDNEDHIKEEEERRKKGNASDSEGEDGDVFVDDDENGSNSGQSEDDEEDSEAAILKRIAKVKKEGKYDGTAGALIDNNVDDDDDDDEDDSDYEYTGGDLAIYDSALDEVDELLFVKDCFERLNQLDANYVASLMSVMDPTEQGNFI